MDTQRTPRNGTARGRGGRGRQPLPFRVARDLLTVRRAFGEPIQRDDVTLVPVARVMGCSCSCSGGGPRKKPATTDAAPDADGSGGCGGLGMRVAPVGVYVLNGSDVRWQPAMDLNRIILGGQIVGLVTVLAIARTLRRRRH
jgi:uncharacterized spore protein YtfJ